MFKRMIALWALRKLSRRFPAGRTFVGRLFDMALQALARRRR